MMHRLLFLLVLLSSPFLRAGENNAWTLPSNESYLQVVPPPPATNSFADRADVGAVEGLQAQATPAAIAHATKTAALSVWLFSEVRGADFTAAAYPKTDAFFTILQNESASPYNWLKNRYQRQRPYLGHPWKIKALIPIASGYSYPSGHATVSWLDALVLGELDPAHRADYLGSAFQISMDRSVGGMHYPSDTAAGRVLAEAIFADLMADPAFKADLEALRKAEYSSK